MPPLSHGEMCGAVVFNIIYPKSRFRCSLDRCETITFLFLNLAPKLKRTVKKNGDDRSGREGKKKKSGVLKKYK